MADNVYEKIQTKVKESVDDQLNLLKKQREINQISDESIGEEGMLREKGIALGAVFKKLDDTQGRVGQVMLATLWQMHTDHIFELVYESADAQEYVEDTRDQYRDYYYARSLAKVVDTILTYVEKRATAGNPVLDPETGVEITIEMLIGVEGTISKLKEQADYVINLEKDSDRDAIIGAIGTGQSRTKVDSKREKIEGNNTDPGFKIEATESMNPDTKTTQVVMELDETKYQYLRRTVLIAAVDEAGGKKVVTFESLSDADLARLRKALGKTLVLHQKAKEVEKKEEAKEENVQQPLPES